MYNKRNQMFFYPEPPIHSQFAQQTMTVKLMSLVRAHSGAKEKAVLIRTALWLPELGSNQ